MSLNPNLGPLIIPSIIDAFENSFYTLQNPTTNSTGNFIYSSNNTSILKIINNNKAIFLSNGTVTITCTITATTSYKSSFTSATVQIINVPSNNGNNFNTAKKTNKSKDGNLTITNYNPFTNNIPFYGDWIYFYYTFTNKYNLTHYINNTITLAGDVSFNYSILNNSDVYVLYSGTGGKGGVKSNTAYGGGSGEICMTKINYSDLGSKIYVNVKQNVTPITGYPTQGNTELYYENKNNMLSKKYYAYNGYNGYNNENTLNNGKGAPYHTEDYDNNTISFGSLNGALPGYTVSSGLNVYFSGDGAGSYTFTGLSGNGGSNKKASTSGNNAFVVIFYKINPTYFVVSNDNKKPRSSAMVFQSSDDGSDSAM